MISITTLSLAKICEADERFPDIKTWYRWMLSHPELRQEYAHAKNEQLEILADEISAIADETQPSEIITIKADGSREVKIVDATEHRRLRIDTRKWLLSKLKPKTYGDRQEIEHSGALQVISSIPRPSGDK
jgi:hypothetical protein